MSTALAGLRVGSYLHTVWEYRFFWFSLVRQDIRTRYRRSVLGVVWSLLNPLALTAILCMVYGRLFHVPIWQTIPFLLSGLAFWDFIAGSVNTGCQSFLTAESYIRNEPVPLAVFPLRNVLVQGFHFLIALAVALVFAWLAAGGGSVEHALALVSLVPVLLLLLVVGWSVAVLAAFSNVFYPDTQHISDVALKALFYAAPIIYPPQLLEGKTLGLLLQYNPLAVLVNLVRQPILYGQIPSAASSLLAGLFALVLASAASLVLARNEHRVIFQI